MYIGLLQKNRFAHFCRKLPYWLKKAIHYFPLKNTGITHYLSVSLRFSFCSKIEQVSKKKQTPYTMKYFTNLLALAFSILICTATQANESTNPIYIYTIHVGAFDKAQLSDFDGIRDIGYVYAFPLRDNLMQVFLGGYSSRKTARQLLPGVHESGYPDAYVMRRALDEGEEIATVQIALKKPGHDLDFGKYLQAGKIYISQNDNELRVVSGQYETAEIAQKRANQLKRMGFADAMVKTMNTVELIKLTSFESGGAVAGSIIEVIETSKGGESEVKIKVSNLPDSYDILFKKSKNTSKGGTSIPTDIPDDFEGKTERINVPVKKKDKVDLPKIRVKVKRTSAIELQKILKAQGVYNSGLDGYYGKGTAKGYADIKKENYQIRKYLMLSEMMNEDASNSLKSSHLQTIINNLLSESANANTLLQAERSPLAKVYRAYILFQNRGQLAEVNRLMNAAIKQTFKGKKIRNSPPFDYNATYAYDNLEQLLKHLNYIHAVSQDAEVPCWIFSQHPLEAANAFASGGESLRMQNCGGDFMSWEETKLLKAIAADLDPSIGIDQDRLAAYTSKRAKLFIAPQKMTSGETAEVSVWHKTLWTEMESWGAADPIHEKRVAALKVAYFQSQVRVEDYFMNKGFTYQEAKPLAMCVLQTIVGKHFANYMKG